MGDPMTGLIDFNKRLESFGSERYESLRDAQTLALDGWRSHQRDPDIAVELPTGYGKTLVALLIADFELEMGRTVAYLTGTNQLADQVLIQARDLPGLDVVKFSARNYPPAHLAAYHDAKAVGVMNYWTYFNTSPKVEPADLVIFDDAHLAEQPLSGMFGIRIDRRTQRALYESFCDLILAHTDVYPSIDLMRDDEAGPSTPPELLAFSHWAAISEAAADLLSGNLQSEDVRFNWPRVRPNLRTCGVLIGPSAIEIRPYLPPTQTLPGYRHSKQRLYLSATLGTMDDLQRRLGVASVVSVMDEGVTEDQIGRRLFILNPGDNAPLDEGPIRFALAQSEQAGRTAWLCSSHSEADRLEGLLLERGIASYRLRGAGDDDVLERWAANVNGHLVTAGRFDGLDLAGDLCRLVILPSVPAASTEFERFIMAYLGDATFMRHRVGQRVTQALGRANRRKEDWAMYIGLAPGFGTLLAQSAVRQAIPIDVRPLVDQALERLKGGWPLAHHEAQEFWSNRGGSRIASVESTAPTRPRPGRSRTAGTAGSANDEVNAITRLWLGDASGAARAAEGAAVALDAASEVEHAAFWRYVQAQALYEESTSGSTGRAIEALRIAIQGGTKTAWFVRLNRVLGELRGEQAVRVEDQPWTTWDEWIGQAGPAGVQRAIDQCRASLRGSHDQQAEGLEILGRMSGVEARRPSGQSVTDTEWAWAESRKLEIRMWEIKTGSPDAVPREWVDQILGQIAGARPDGRRHVIGCLVTQLELVSPEAAQAARDSICLIHLEAIEALATLLADRLYEYTNRWGEGSAAERGSAREKVEERMPVGKWITELFTPTNGKLMRRDAVIAKFPN